MAKKPSLGYGLSRAATIAGWCYLPFYLVRLLSGNYSSCLS